MKKALFLLMIPLSVAGQCKDAKLYTDDMKPDVKIYSTATGKLNNGMDDKTITFKKMNDSFYLTMSDTEYGAKSKVCGSGDEMIIKLGNDSLIKAKSIGIYSGKVHYYSSGNMTTFSATYDIEKEDIALIAQYGIKKIRYYLTSSSGEFEIKDKFQDKIKAAAKCIIE